MPRERRVIANIDYFGAIPKPADQARPGSPLSTLALSITVPSMMSRGRLLFRPWLGFPVCFFLWRTVDGCGETKH